MKNDYKKQIHELFEELRGEIEIKNELHILMLENFERMEQRALEENSKEEVRRIQKMIEKRNQKVFNFPLAKKRVEIKDDTIVVTALP